MKKEDVPINLMTIVLDIPDNTIKLTVIADIIDADGDQHQAETYLTLPELYEARVVGEEWMMENAKYVLTDIGKSTVDESKGD